MISSYPLHLRPQKSKLPIWTTPQEVKFAGSCARQPVSTAARATRQPGHRSVPVNWGLVAADRAGSGRQGRRPAGAAPPSRAPRRRPLPVVAAPGSDAPSWACGRRRAQVSRARLARVHAPLSCGPRALTPRVAVADPARRGRSPVCSRARVAVAPRTRTWSATSRASGAPRTASARSQPQAWRLASESRGCRAGAGGPFSKASSRARLLSLHWVWGVGGGASLPGGGWLPCSCS